MGNTTSDITDNVKAQADAQESPVYRLVDVKGRGELVKLMKAAKLSNDFSVIDKEINDQVGKFLYNNGEGEYVKELIFKTNNIPVTVQVNAWFFLIFFKFSIQSLVWNRSASKDKARAQPTSKTNFEFKNGFPS
jgi:hypothetical protein